MAERNKLMEFSIQQIAQLLEGKIEGDQEAKVSNLGKIETAEAGDLCFLANPKYENHIYDTRATAVIVNEDFTPKKEVKTTLVRVKDAYNGFTKILTFYQEYLKSTKVGVEEPSFVGENTTVGEHIFRGAFSYIGKHCTIGNNVKIYPNVSIDDHVFIGDHTIIYAGVKIYAGCKIGAHCTIHAGAVIGSHGFGFVPQQDGTFAPIPQIGNVVLENYVDIGANATIDCATMGSTLIKEGAKIDNLVQIAHNVEIGKHTGIAAQTGISGSTKVGDHCIIAGQVGMAGHISLANKTTVGAQSGISKNVTQEGTFLNGSPAFAYKDHMKSLVIFRNLPELDKQVQELRKKILNLPLS